MYKKCKTERSRKRQLEIEQAFLKCLSQKLYEDITVSELCVVANIPRKAFYRYFETKEGVLHALIDHTLQGYEEYYQAKRKDRRTINGDLEAYFSFWLTEPRTSLLQALKKSDLIDSLYKYSKDLANSGFINTARFLPEETKWRQKQIFNFAITGLMTIMLDWFEGGCVQSTVEMAEISKRILNSPLFPKLEELGILNE